MLHKISVRLRAVLVGATCCSLLMLTAAAPAFETLGTGTEFLLGGDLTDPQDDGDPENDVGYDAIFNSNDEPGFGGGEFAFNVFDNILGPSNDKWCCGKAGGISEDDPIWVSAEFAVPYALTHFTVSSANDVPARDPIHWAIQGSNNGTDWTDIYVYDEGESPWIDRFEVIQWTAGDDFPAQDINTDKYLSFRMATFDTLNNPNGAYFQVGEIEFFGETNITDIPPRPIAGAGDIGMMTVDGTQTNNQFGEPTTVPGWSARIVTNDEHGQQIGDHTTAEIVLEDFEGTPLIGAYPVVDLAGGNGTFPENLPYPNGVNNANQSDFVVQVWADVTIPAGSWSIAIGSDDGAQLTVADPDFAFDEKTHDDFEENMIRFEGNRGHGWTTGTFELEAPLETQIIASFHERGGGDSFEIAVLDDALLEGASPAAGWELLGNDVFGWSVMTEAAPLLSADLEGSMPTSDRGWGFDVNGDTDTADQFKMDNPDPNVFTTILDVDRSRIPYSPDWCRRIRRCVPDRLGRSNHWYSDDCFTRRSELGIRCVDR